MGALSEAELQELAASYDGLSNEWRQRDWDDRETTISLADRLFRSGLTRIALIEADVHVSTMHFAHLHDGLRFGLDGVRVAITSLSDVRVFVEENPQLWQPGYGDVDATFGPLPEPTPAPEAS